MSKNEERYLLQALEFEGLLRARLYRYTHSDSDVEDLLQETYARLLTAAASDDPEVLSVRAFSLTVARNVAFDRLRHEAVMPVELIADMETPDALHEDEQVEEIVTDERLATLVEAIQGLPDRCRQAFTLRKVYGYTPGQIVSRLGISASTVEQDLTTAARHCARSVFEQPVRKRRPKLFDRFGRHKRVA